MENTKQNSTTKFARWKGGDYDDFLYSKDTNFDLDIYLITTPIVGKKYNLTAEIVKPLGEKMTEEDITDGFIRALAEEMTDDDFEEYSAEHFFEALPPEFYSPENCEAVLEEMRKKRSDEPEIAERQEVATRQFMEYAHKVNPDEILLGDQSVHTANRSYLGM